MSFDADPLFNEKNAFYKGLYHTVVDDTTNKDGAQSLRLRAQIELDPAKMVKDLKSSKDDLGKAAYSLALHRTGKATEAYKIADTLTTSDDPDVQLIVATVLARDISSGRYEDAIDILSSMEDSLESVAILIQIYLSTNQLSQAQSTLKAAKSWAQDAELIQLADAWVSLRQGGDGYQSAFYTFQEFADSNGAPTRMQLAQAVTEIELGHYDEAASTLSQILAKEPENADALANMVTLSGLTGQDASTHLDTLQASDSTHPAVVQYNEKSAEFDSLAKNYTFVTA